MSNGVADVHYQKCSECGQPHGNRGPVCSDKCALARKTRLQKERRKAALRPSVRSSLVFMWAFHAVHETLRRMQEGVRSLTAEKLGMDQQEFTGEDLKTLAEFLNELKVGTPSARALFKNAVEEDCAARIIARLVAGGDAIAEPELLTRLLNADNPETVREIVNESRWLRGGGDGQGNLLGSLLWKHPYFLISVKKNQHRRLRTHPNHSDERMVFFAKAIAAESAGYKMSAGDGHLACYIERCANCKRPASKEHIACLHRVPTQKVNSFHLRLQSAKSLRIIPKQRCPRCDAVGTPEQVIGQTYCPNCTEPNAAGERVCVKCGTKLPTFTVNPHSQEECRNSTWPCPIHDMVILPETSYRCCDACIAELLERQ